MTRSLRPRIALLLLLVLGLALLPRALAQDEAAEQSRLQQFLEQALSTPERTVRIGEIGGLLSSTVTIDSVSVADPAGVWLELEELELSWNRLALFRGRLEIERLRAARIVWSRRPAEEAEADGGAPSLPLSIDIQAIEAPVIEIGPAVVGMPATLAARGSLSALADSVEAQVEVDRLDEPGGSLSADFAFDPAANLLRADATVREPPGGLVAAFLNLPGRPSIELTLDGEGQLDDWRAELALAADGEPALAGEARIARVEDGYRAVADVSGRLGRIAPPQYQALLAGEARLALDAVRQDDGTIRLARAELTAESAAFTAEGVLAADFVPRQGRLDLRLGPAGEVIALPFVPGAPRIRSALIEARLQGDADGSWTATATLDGLDHADAAVERLILEASGTARSLANAAERALTYSARAEARGIAARDPAIAAAIGERLTLEAQGDWEAGGPLRVAALTARTESLSLAFSGSAAAERIDGRYRLETADLSRLAPLLGRELAGRLTVDATGAVGPADASFDLTIDGRAEDLATGIAALDPLLAGPVRLEGGVARTEGGFRLDGLRLESEAATARLRGSLAEPALDLSLEAEVADLSRLSDRASGAARLSGTVAGTAEAPRLAVTAEGADVVLMGRRLADASARFEGVVAGPDTAGTASLRGTLDGVPVEGSAELSALPDGGRRLEGLSLSAGRNVAEGSLTIHPDGLLDGALTVRAPEIEVIAPLLLAEASGAARLDVRLETADGQQAARIAGDIAGLSYEEFAVGSAEIDLAATDLFGAPIVEGRFAARSLAFGGMAIAAAEGTARRIGERTEFDVVASLAEGEAALAGSLDPIPGGFAVALDRLSLTHAGETLRLAEPSVVEVRDGTAVLDRLALAVNGGRAVVSGRAGATLDIRAEVAGFSAALANAVAPALEAQGTISGTLAATGTPAAPRIAFDAAWRGASVRATREAGLGPFDAAAEGTYAEGTVRLTAELQSTAGLALSVAGAANVTGAGALDLRVTGEAPLALASRQLEDRGTRLAGTLAVDISVGGRLADPTFTGRLTTREAALVDPETGIVLRDLGLAARFAGDELVLESLTATSGPGGTVSGSGSVGLDPAAGYPLDLALTIRDGRYVDGQLIAATLDADLTVTGPAARPTIGGTIVIERAEVTVPERLPHDHVAVEVRHVAAPPAVEATVRQARPRERPAEAGGEPTGVVLDVVIEAPARIFVRGRGLDAELGGRLALTGPVSNIAAAGDFNLRRGHIDILTQRITFQHGTLDFAGDLDPVIELEATTQSGDILVTVTVTGRASDPAIAFSSVPELPQDEVLAHLLFRRSLSDLSPLQLALLATAAAELGGLTEGPGLIGRLRAATGLDVLDVVPAEDGGLAVQAGRYVNENIYLGLEQGATAESSRVTIELDLTPELKARGAVRGDGASSLGIFFEREY
jgi:translocation and assembly module TamB